MNIPTKFRRIVFGRRNFVRILHSPAKFNAKIFVNRQNFRGPPKPNIKESLVFRQKFPTKYRRNMICQKYLMKFWRKHLLYWNFVSGFWFLRILSEYFNGIPMKFWRNNLYIRVSVWGFISSEIRRNILPKLVLSSQFRRNFLMEFRRKIDFHMK